MKRAIILSGLLVAVFSMVGVQGVFAKGHTGTCTVTNPDGTKTETETTAKDCKGEFKAKSGKAKKAK